jgi:predicted enzyme related to lactoylglutathione lyase
MSHPVNWFHFSSTDKAALQDFYKKVFDWKMSLGPDGTGMVSAAPGGIPGGIGGSTDGKSSAAIYIGVANLEEQLKKIEAHGGKQAMPAMELGGGMGRIAGFHDPQGIWVGLWEAGAPAKKAPARRAAAKKAAPKKAAAKKAAPKKAPAKKAPAKKAPAKKKAAPKKAAKA